MLLKWTPSLIQPEWAITTFCPELENEKITHLFTCCKCSQAWKDFFYSVFQSFQANGPTGSLRVSQVICHFHFLLVFLLITFSATHQLWTPATDFSLQFHQSLFFFVLSLVIQSTRDHMSSPF